MPKAYIFNDHLDAADRAAIEAAVQAAGCEVVYGAPLNISSLDPADIGVVGLPVAPEDVATVNARTQAFGGAGIRVVGIWLRDEVGGRTGLPEGIGKYGSATVKVGSPALPGALKGENETWEKPTGEPRPAPPMKRNKC